MTYNVFGWTLNLAQSLSLLPQSWYSSCKTLIAKTVEQHRLLCHSSGVGTCWCRRRADGRLLDRYLVSELLLKLQPDDSAITAVLMVVVSSSRSALVLIN